MQCSLSASCFIYDVANLAAGVPTPSCLVCHTVERSVPVVASREENIRALALAISIHSLVQQLKLPEKEKFQRYLCCERFWVFLMGQLSLEQGWLRTN